MSDNGIQSLNEQLAMMQKRVKITLDWDDPNAVAVGQLVGLSEDGQATIIQDDMMRHYVWPVLKIEETSYNGELLSKPIQSTPESTFWTGVATAIICLCIVVLAVSGTVRLVAWIWP